MARISQPGAGAPAETADDQSAPEARVDMPSEQPEVQAASSDADAAQTGGAAGGAADAAASDSPHEDAPSAEQQNEELEEEDEGQHGEDAEDEAEAGVEEQPAGGESGDAAARAGQAAGDSCDSAEQQREADEPAEAVAEEGEGDAAGEQDGDAADEDEAEEEEAEAEGAEEEAQASWAGRGCCNAELQCRDGCGRRPLPASKLNPPASLPTPGAAGRLRLCRCRSGDACQRWQQPPHQQADLHRPPQVPGAAGGWDLRGLAGTSRVMIWRGSEALACGAAAACAQPRSRSCRPPVHSSTPATPMGSACSPGLVARAGDSQTLRYIPPLPLLPRHLAAPHLLRPRPPLAQPRLAARANYSHSQARVRQILRDNEALVRRLG